MEVVRCTARRQPSFQELCARKIVTGASLVSFWSVLRRCRVGTLSPLTHNPLSKHPIPSKFPAWCPRTSYLNLRGESGTRGIGDEQVTIMGKSCRGWCAIPPVTALPPSRLSAIWPSYFLGSRPTVGQCVSHCGLLHRSSKVVMSVYISVNTRRSSTTYCQPAISLHFSLACCRSFTTGTLWCIVHPGRSVVPYPSGFSTGNPQF